MAAEGSSGSSGGGGGRKTPSPHKARERVAAKFLAGLPSRGNFSSSSISSSLGGLRVYVCEHDTDPPEEAGDEGSDVQESWQSNIDLGIAK